MRAVGPAALPRNGAGGSTIRAVPPPPASFAPTAIALSTQASTYAGYVPSRDGRCSNRCTKSAETAKPAPLAVSRTGAPARIYCSRLRQAGVDHDVVLVTALGSVGVRTILGRSIFFSIGSVPTVLTRRRRRRFATNAYTSSPGPSPQTLRASPPLPAAKPPNSKPGHPTASPARPISPSKSSASSAPKANKSTSATHEHTHPVGMSQFRGA